jgi:hypothetical protein
MRTTNFSGVLMFFGSFFIIYVKWHDNLKWKEHFSPHEFRNWLQSDVPRELRMGYAQTKMRRDGGDTWKDDAHWSLSHSLISHHRAVTIKQSAAFSDKLWCVFVRCVAPETWISHIWYNLLTVFFDNADCMKYEHKHIGYSWVAVPVGILQSNFRYVCRLIFSLMQGSLCFLNVNPIFLVVAEKFYCCSWFETNQNNYVRRICVHCVAYTQQCCRLLLRNITVWMFA